MADHFDRLLARGVPGYPAADPVARPRLPRLFEPVDAGPEVEAAWSPSPVPVVRPEPGAPGPAGPRGPAGDTPRVPPPPAPAVAPVPAPPVSAPVPVATSETLVTTERTRHEVVREPVVEQRVTTVDVTMRPAAPVAGPRPRHTTVVVPPPKVEPRRAPAPSPSPVPKPEQPVVHVSIGRVEVTATVSERGWTPRSAPRRPEPVLSLERYLAREDGGR